MYGTIFNLKVKPGHEAALIKVFNEEQGNPAGAVALFVMQPDANGPWTVSYTHLTLPTIYSV